MFLEGLARRERRLRIASTLSLHGLGALDAFMGFSAMVAAKEG